MKKKVMLLTYTSLISGIKWIMYCLRNCKTETNLTIRDFVGRRHISGNHERYFTNTTSQIETLYSNYMTYIIDIFKHEDEEILNNKSLDYIIPTMYPSMNLIKDMLTESIKLTKEIVDRNTDIVLVRYFSENLFVSWHLCYNLKKIKPNIKIVMGTMHRIDQDIVETYFIKENIADYFIYGNPNSYLQQIIDEEYEGERIIFNYKYTKEEVIEVNKITTFEEFRKKEVDIITSMFCFRRCNFCTQTLTNNKYFQLNNDEILNTVADIKKKINTNKFSIVSSNYAFNVEDINFYKNNQLKFATELNSLVNNEKYLVGDKKIIGTGLETLSEKICKAMGKKCDKNTEILVILKDILKRNQNIYITFFNIYNFFLENKEEFDISYENYLKYIPNSPSVFLQFYRYRHATLNNFDPSIYEYTKLFDDKFKEMYNTQHVYVLLKHKHSYDGLITYKENKIKQITKYLNKIKVDMYYQ